MAQFVHSLPRHDHPTNADGNYGRPGRPSDSDGFNPPARSSTTVLVLRNASSLRVGPMDQLQSHRVRRRLPRRKPAPVVSGRICRFRDTHFAAGRPVQFPPRPTMVVSHQCACTALSDRQSAGARRNGGDDDLLLRNPPDSFCARPRRTNLQSAVPKRSPGTKYPRMSAGRTTSARRKGHFPDDEYVDGEDRARLLRRIGKLQRALDAARTMRGLVAAYDRGHPPEACQRDARR
jgi:hypothetical protein